jgi:hypothetical protein
VGDISDNGVVNNEKEDDDGEEDSDGGINRVKMGERRLSSNVFSTALTQNTLLTNNANARCIHDGYSELNAATSTE